MRYKPTLVFVTSLLLLMFAIESFGQARKSKSPRGLQNKPRRQQQSQTGFAGDYKALVKKLRAAASVTPGEKVSQPFFSVSGRTLNFKGEQIQVYEYAKAATAAKESGQVSADGSPVGTTMITWVAPPHFYKNGRLIVLYIGENSGVIKALETALGRQFAGK